MDDTMNRQEGDSKSPALKEPPVKKAATPSKAKVERKADGKPKRPLSAYNLFFKEQRAKMLEEIAQGCTDYDADDAQAEAALAKGERVDRRKSGLFAKMAQTIAKRWKMIHKEDMKRYEDQATVEKERYKKELAEYNRRMVEECTQSMERRRQERKKMAEDSENFFVSAMAAQQAAQANMAQSNFLQQSQMAGMLQQPPAANHEQLLFQQQQYMQSLLPGAFGFPGGMGAPLSLFMQPPQGQAALSNQLAQQIPHQASSQWDALRYSLASLPAPPAVSLSQPHDGESAAESWERMQERQPEEVVVGAAKHNGDPKSDGDD